MDENPYAPPTEAAAEAHGGLVFSPEGAAVVSSLATWMRTLGMLYYLGTGVFVLFGFFAVFTGGGLGVFILVAFALVAVFLGLMAGWVRDAGTNFERGVHGDDEFPIGRGFRSLRAYFIAAGILAILQLLQALSSLTEVM